MRTRFRRWLGLRRSITAAPGPFQRLWAGFLTGRLMLSLAIAVLLLTEYLIGGVVPVRVLWLVGIYFGQSLVLRIAMRSMHPGRELSLHWLMTVGFDIAVCALLQVWYVGERPLSFTALFGVPVLMAAAIGSTAVMGLTVATVFATLMLVTAISHGFSLDNPQIYYQAFLAWLGFLVLALLIHQLATRLTREEQEASRSRQAALVQSQISELIISNLNDGVIVLDEGMNVNSINPAALAMLGVHQQKSLPFSLQHDEAWRPLTALAGYTFKRRTPQSADLTLMPEQQNPVGVHARSWLTQEVMQARRSIGAQCVIFMHDLREMQAQLRTEKLAAMGRMSAAVAHEIRNPLSAIMQANALLAEDLNDPGAQRLSTMIGQNAERLSRIAEDILDIARVQRQIPDAEASRLALDETVQQIWQDWSTHNPTRRKGTVELHTQSTTVPFDYEHLRRILVNLLDNALRYMGQEPDSLQIHSWLNPNGQAVLQVWSDGAPLEKSVERHLFEPFFSSESRSSGLGLYLCRELCERHDASISYRRLERETLQGNKAGNAFTVHFRRPARATTPKDSRINELVV